MPDNKDRAKKYFTSVYAALIVIALLIGGFIYSLVKNTPENIDEIIYPETKNGTPIINPSGDLVPNKPPYVEPPTSLPSN